MAPRDSQRSRVYAAEQALRDVVTVADDTGVRTIESCGSVFEIPVEYKFGSLADVQDYCDKALASVRWSGSPVRVVQAHGNQSKAHYVASEIHLPIRAAESWAWRELVVLHELAHHLTAGDQHGERFAGAMVRLVTEMIGPEMGFLLRMNYLQNGVRLSEYEAA